MKTKTFLLGAAAVAALAFKAAPAMPISGGEHTLGFAFKRNETVRATTFVPIFKVDAETRTVYGRLADETPDITGEVFDYDTSAPLFRTWTENAVKTTGGKSAGNLRVMHGLKVAGKLTEVTFDDVAKTIDIAAEVVDDAEWEMVEKGCYTGFSLGGRYVKKWKDKAANKTRYTVNPFEASLVDLPCIPSATFSFKAAGGEERQVEFIGWTPTDEEIASKAAELAGADGDAAEHTGAALEALKAEYIARAADAEIKEPSGDEDEDEDDDEKGEKKAKKAAPGSPEADAEEGLSQRWIARDGSAHATKAAARAHHAALDAAAAKAADPVAQAVAALKGAINPEDAPAAEADAPATYVVDGAAEAFADLLTVKAIFDANVVNKGIYDVRSLADLVQSLSWLTDNSICEAGQEKDGSPVPAQLMGHLRGLSNTLVTMAREETAEMIAMLQKRGVDVQVFVDTTVTKAVAISVADANKAAGDDAALPSVEVSAEMMELIEKAAGRLPADPEGDGQGETVTKAAFVALEAENTALKAQMTDEVVPALRDATAAVQSLRDELTATKTEVQALKDTPLPSAHRGAGTVVTKTQDATPGGHAAPIDGKDASEVIDNAVKTFGAEAVSAALIKQAQQRPTTV